MKTAEEWVFDYYVKHTVADPDDQSGSRVVPPKEAWLEQIQSDAKRDGRIQGLREAAEIARHNEQGCVREIKHSILARVIELEVGK